MPAKFKLLRDLVLILPIKDGYKSPNGLIVSTNDPNTPLNGVVVEVGPGVYNKKGELVPVPVSKGDKVVFIKSACKELKVEGDTLLVVPQEDILCIVSNV